MPCDFWSTKLRQRLQGMHFQKRIQTVAEIRITEKLLLNPVVLEGGIMQPPSLGTAPLVTDSLFNEQGMVHARPLA